MRILSIFAALYFVLGPLGAQPLNLHFDARVSNAADLKDQIPQIPTQFEFYRRDGSIDLNDPKFLYTAYKRVHGPYFLPPSKIEENPSGERDINNPSILDYAINVLELSLRTSAKSDLYLRQTGFLVFPNFSLIQTALIIPPLCKTDELKNEARCDIKFPSVQVATPNLENISSIRMRVFRKGEISAAEIQALPTEILPKLDEHLKANARLDTEDKETGKRKGYFLIANYHFESALKESNEGMRNDKTYEWRFALSQAYGRLALMAGDYWLEREVLSADGRREIEVALVSLAFGDYRSRSDLNWTKVEDPREYHPQ